MIVDYTTPDEIRSILGVSVDELADTTILLPIYENYLTMELEEVQIDLPDTYATTDALPTPSEVEMRFLNTARMFASFALAKRLSGSLPMFALKKETDGKAQGERFDNPYRDLIAGIGKDYDRTKAKLIQALNALGASSTVTTPRSYFSTVALGTDPITNA